MGLFDNMIKKGLGNALGGALGDKVTEALEQATGLDLNADGQQGGRNPFGSVQESTFNPSQQAAQTSYAAAPVMQETDKPYFRAIINENFSNYTIREDVPVAELGGDGRAYDFALVSGGQCCGVIMLVEHNRDNNRAYKGAREAAQAAGVPFINFYTHMPNERDFVINRIRRLARPAV